MQFVSLKGARLDGCNMRNVNLQFSDLGGCNWKDADTTGADLRNWYVQYASILALTLFVHISLSVHFTATETTLKKTKTCKLKETLLVYSSIMD